MSELRSPLPFDKANPPCDDDECILPASIIYPIMDERMVQGSEPDAPWRAKLAAAKAEYRRAKQQQQTNDRGNEMCTCKQGDPFARERDARKKMIADGANAYLKPTIDEHDDEKPAAPASRATTPTTTNIVTHVNTPSAREIAARAELRRAGREAYKTVPHEEG